MFLIVQMRLNKVSELIHNSTNHQNLDSAGVSVQFQEIVDLVIYLVFLNWLLLIVHLVAIMQLILLFVRLDWA